MANGRSYINQDSSPLVLSTLHTPDEVITLTLDEVVPKGQLIARNTTNGKLVSYQAAAGVAGSAIPIGVMQYDLTATAAGDYPVRPLLAGTVVKEKLVTKLADPITNMVLDQLRSYGVIAVSVDELGAYNNS